MVEKTANYKTYGPYVGVANIVVVRTYIKLLLIVPKGNNGGNNETKKGKKINKRRVKNNEEAKSPACGRKYCSTADTARRQSGESCSIKNLRRRRGPSGRSLQTRPEGRRFNMIHSSIILRMYMLSTTPRKGRNKYG